MFWYLSADSSVKSPKDDYLQKIKIFAVKKRCSCLASDIFLILLSNTSVLFQFENSNVNKQDIIIIIIINNLKNQKKILISRQIAYGNLVQKAANQKKTQRNKKKDSFAQNGLKNRDLFSMHRYKG